MTDPVQDRPARTGLTRDELYKRVWTTPMRTLASEFGMSDRGLAKLCERHAIPVPGLGYWRRKETGKRVRQLPLPELHLNHQHLATMPLPDSAATAPQVIVTMKPRQQPPPEPPPDPPLVAAQRAFEVANPILVGDLPERPHPLVRATRTGLRKAKDGSTVAVHASGDNSLNVTVTAGTRDRALRILEALCRAFKARGFPLTTRHQDRRETRVTVHGIAITLFLEERVQRKERMKPKARPGLLNSLYVPFQDRYDWIPTGELVLKAWLDQGSKHKWADGKRQRLESRLNQVMIDLVVIVDSEMRWRRERAERQRRDQEAQIRRMKEEELRREEGQRGKDLGELAAKWQEAERLQAFIAAVRLRADSEGRLEPDGQLDRWLRWAQGHVSDRDPLNGLDAFPPPYKRRAYWDQDSADQWPSSPLPLTTEQGNQLTDMGDRETQKQTGVPRG